MKKNNGMLGKKKGGYQSSVVRDEDCCKFRGYSKKHNGSFKYQDLIDNYFKE